MVTLATRFIIIFCCFYFPCNTIADSRELSSFISNGGYALQTKTAVIQFRACEKFVPASTLKILTCLAALELLGKNYHFETHFFVDKNNNLYIKGFGDPFLTSETLLEIAKELRKNGLKRIATIYLDDTSFQLDSPTPGSENSANPYDAPNGALAVNFNALPLLITKNRTVSSGEIQTPDIPLMHEIATTLSPGSYRLNVNTFADMSTTSMPLRYTAELFTAQLKRVKITTDNHYLIKATPRNLQPFLIHYSKKNLAEIVRSCLKYSSNFIANQLFLICGTAAFQFPATWEKSRRFLRNYLTATLSLSQKQVHIVEGSGLSRTNTITPTAFLTILERFKPFAYLLTNKNNVLLKSGTLKNVFCFAGYFHNKDTLKSFVILLNQPQNTRDDILRKLQHTFRQEYLE